MERDPWAVKRPDPYTERGIRRLDCIRCGLAARFQWAICADGNNHRPICAVCDVDLNRLVLEFMLHPRAAELAEAYEKQKLG